MEAVIVKDIMNMATLLIQNPEKIKDLCIKILEKNPDEDELTDDLRKIAKLLEGVESPVHPIEVFDMIVGTSTGKRLKLSACVFTSTSVGCLRAVGLYRTLRPVQKSGKLS